MALLALLLPSAPAQSPVDPAITLTVESSDTPIRPLSGVAKLRVEASLPCPLVSDLSGRAGVLKFHVLDGPAWAHPAILPPEFALPKPQECAGENLAYSASLVVGVDEEALAFERGELRIAASYADAGANRSAEATASVVGGYFSVIDVQVPQPIRIVEPGSTTRFGITINNFGNGATRASFALTEPPRNGFALTLPDDVTMGARQEGDPTHVVVNVLLTAPPGRGYVNEDFLATVRVTGAYAADASITGEQVQFSLIVTSKGFQKFETPSVSVFAGVCALALLALARGAARSR